MEIKDMLPIWNKLTDEQKNLLERTSSKRKIEKGNLLSSKINKCIGLVIVETGQLRAFIVSETGREITLCRLFERDIYLLTASCVLSEIQFEVSRKRIRNIGLYRPMFSSSLWRSQFLFQIIQISLWRHCFRK